MTEYNENKSEDGQREVKLTHVSQLTEYMTFKIWTVVKINKQVWETDSEEPEEASFNPIHVSKLSRKEKERFQSNIHDEWMSDKDTIEFNILIIARLNWMCAEGNGKYTVNTVLKQPILSNNGKYYPVGDRSYHFTLEFDPASGNFLKMTTYQYGTSTIQDTSQLVSIIPCCD